MHIPKPYQRIKENHPALLKAYEALGDACAKAGPLDAKTVAMIKLAISTTAGLEGAAHSHTRKALEAGCSAAELEHVVHLCTPTIGFPAMMRGRSWVTDVTEK